MSGVVFLTVREVLYLHGMALREFGGESGIRDVNLLRSALAVPCSGAGGVYFHADLHEMAAAYLYHIVNNHPFVDGNKRAGLAAVVAFLALNGKRLVCDGERLTEMVLDVANGSLNKDGIASFLRNATGQDSS